MQRDRGKIGMRQDGHGIRSGIPARQLLTSRRAGRVRRKLDASGDDAGVLQRWSEESSQPGHLLCW